MNNELILQILGVLVTIVGLAFIWYQIKRNRKDSMTGSFISSLSERRIMLEERRRKIKDVELEGFYKFLIPEFNKLLEKKYKGNLDSLAADYIFNDDDLEVSGKENGKNKILYIMAKEYLDIDALYGLFEEQFLVGKHLAFVNKQLWKYWEFHIKVTFSSRKMRNYWTLRTNFKTIYPPFFDYAERFLINPPDYNDLIYEEYK